MKRCGNQRKETLQIVNTLFFGSRWRNHPAVLMWEDYPQELIRYGEAMCREWISRGYKDTCLPKFAALKELFSGEDEKPWWLGNERFHESHRSNLLRKKPDYYSQFNWMLPDDLPYFWPSKELQLMRVI